MIDPGNPDFSDTPVSPSRPAFSYRPDAPQSDPCLTIVTPFYNVDAIFHETARCVMHQSLQQFEWVIVNDGSTSSESLSILDEYRHMDPRIRVVDHEANKGLPAARNTGFQAARAEYVLPLDGDDLLEATAAEKWLWFLTTHPEYSFVNSYTARFGPRPYLQRDGFHARTSILAGNLLTYCCLFRKNAYAAVGGYDETIRGGGEDWEFWVRSADQGYWGYTMPEFLFWYRTRENPVDRWSNMQSGGVSAFAKMLSRGHPQLRTRRFPIISEEPGPVVNSIPVEIPFQNRLFRPANEMRLIIIIPRMTVVGAGKFHLDLVEKLTKVGWKVTVATTLDDPKWCGYHEFSRYTPDVFVLPRFLRCSDQPRFLLYLIQSRQPNVVLISDSELGRLALPYLRSRHPETTFVDHFHPGDGDERIAELFDKQQAPHSSRPDSVADSGRLNSRELLDYVNSYMPPDYFGSHAGPFRQMIGLARQARRFYGNYGLLSTMWMAFHYLSVNGHATGGYLGSRREAIKRRLTGLFARTEK